MLYRYKLGLFVGVVTSSTFLVAYFTGPKSSNGPIIRAMFVSFSDHSVVERTLDYKVSLAERFDRNVHIFEAFEDECITIDRDEWDLREESVPGEDFFENNFLLECTASFPISWKYSGYGAPSVAEKNVRIHENFNDSSTYIYVSILNLMPLSEKSTGLYECFGITNETKETTTRLQLYVAGNTFILDHDTYVEVDGKDEISVPCPVTNSTANISVYFKNQAIESDNAGNLLTFDPKFGFHLKPKFLEEQNDPWGQYYCKNEETKEKSGIITIQPQKVHAIPETRTILLSKPSIRTGGIRSRTSDDKVKFICQAKEEVTLKFLRVVVNPMVHYDYNASSNFPFTTFAEANRRYFRNQSKIYCRTVRNNEDLHSWTVLFAEPSEPSESMDLHYDSNRKEFSCCSSSNKRTKMSIIECKSLSECQIQSNCLRPGQKCAPSRIIELPERSGCVRYKLRLDENDKNPTGQVSLILESGVIQCLIDDRSKHLVYFASQLENGTNLKMITGTLSGLESAEPRSSVSEFNASAMPLDGFLEITRLPSKLAKSGLQTYVCRGAKFFVAVGFRWHTTDEDDKLNVNFGRDVVKGNWIVSRIQLPKQIKRVYCMAPLWNEDGSWVYVKFETNK